MQLPVVCCTRWMVNWTRHGIAVSPVATLDTLSSSILGLSSSILLQTENTSTSIVTSRHDSHDRKQQQSVGTNGSGGPIVHKTQLLVGCTDVGTIYVWRVHPHAMLTSTPNYSPVLDAGMHLLSMVHSSDYPVINASVVLLDKTKNEKSYSFNHIEIEPDESILLLAASDTRGNVRMHSSTLGDIYAEKYSPASRAPSNKSPLSLVARSQMLSPAGRSQAMSPSQRSQLSAMSELRSPHSIGPMVRLLARSPTKSDPAPIMVLFSLMGEAAYDSPVLMCRFRNVLKRIGQDGGESTTVYTDVLEVGSAYLDIFLSNGTMKEIKADTLLKLPNHHVNMEEDVPIDASSGDADNDDDDVPRLQIPMPSPRKAPGVDKHENRSDRRRIDAQSDSVVVEKKEERAERVEIRSYVAHESHSTTEERQQATHESKQPSPPGRSASRVYNTAHDR
jgi:hypothetical protein